MDAASYSDSCQNYMINSFQRFCSFNVLYDSSYHVCRNVRWKDSTIDFEEHRIETILKTEEDLRNYEYKQALFNCFSIIERGKPRDIRACHINDRLVQNALCEQSLLPELTPKFIYDNCATLQNKGIDFALNRAKRHLQQAHRKYGLENGFYALRIDIQKYFDSINHRALKNAVKHTVKDPDIALLCNYLIDTFAFKPTKDKKRNPNKKYYITKKGKYILYDRQYFNSYQTIYEYNEKSLGLGSQTSQLFALLMLNEIDHFIKERLHIKYYGRYMDDLYLLHNDKEYLQFCKKQIEIKLHEIGLSLNQKKTTISYISPILPKETTHGVSFKYLKWNFYITTTNKIILIPFTEKITKQRRKLRKMQCLWQSGTLPTEAIQQSYQGWRAHIKKGNSFYILQDMDNYFRSLFKGVEII